MERREAQIPSLEDKIAAYNEDFRNMQEKELEILRPIMDELRSKVCAIQHEMASLWTDYTNRMSKAQEYTQQQIADLRKQTGGLEQENSSSTSFPTTIHHFPAELLTEILGIVIEGYEQNPFTIMRVCRSWRATVLSMAFVWSQFTVRPWTSQEQMEFMVERAKHVNLDVVVDLDLSRPSFMHSTKAKGNYKGLGLAVTTMSRWRTLNVVAFPQEPDVSAAPAGGGDLPVTFSGPLERLEAFKVTGICESSASFNKLLDTVATTATERLTYIEIATPSALCHLASPNYHFFFSRLRHFKVDVEEMGDPADILSYFENLEVLEASRLHLPVYHHDVDLPVVRTLRRMSIKVVSVQWMSGRTFPSLEECTIIWPHRPETLCLRGGVSLPVCRQFTYDDHLIGPMSEFCAPKLDKLVVRNEAWNRPRGSAQLASVWGGSVDTRWLRPRILHLDTHCFDQYLINALQLHPGLEELILGLVDPYGLSKKFFNNLVARRLKGTSLSSVSSSGPKQPNAV